MKHVAHQKATASKRVALADARTRIADIEAQILELERLFQSLEEEKAVLQDQLDSYVYPVLTLPNEIVSEIFIRFLPIYPKRPPKSGLLSPTILGHICRTWRDIAFSTPALWRSIGVFIPTADPKRIEAESRAMKIMLTRSGSCPLSIDMVSSLFSQRQLDPFVDSIASYCDRWEHLRLFASSRHLYALEGPLPLLRTLTLGLWRTQKDDSRLPNAFHTAPLLRQVALSRYYHCLHAMLPWSQLTVLVVNSIMPHKCGLVLNHTPRLVHCRLVLKNTDDAQASPVPHNAITLQCLEMLVLRTHEAGDEILDGILPALTLPALCRLQISVALFWPSPIDTLRALLSRSDCALQKLRILDVYHQVNRACARSVKLYREAFPTVAVSFAQEMDVKPMFSCFEYYRSDSDHQNNFDTDEELSVWGDGNTSEDDSDFDL
ncbi:F-box domain-containing protein [Mycena venus]|uniref:F-box domain-containing protein n=1 Tax=Mycena venus TaxID=2733690 RepID=A0A8H6XL65_9AGAR|nr:F-box domain-containing protein [Mycena venus]